MTFARRLLAGLAEMEETKPGGLNRDAKRFCNIDRQIAAVPLALDCHQQRVLLLVIYDDMKQPQKQAYQHLQSAKRDSYHTWSEIICFSSAKPVPDNVVR